jgi:DNA primase
VPTIEHEFLVELFQNEPDLAPRLVADVFGIQMPAYTAARLECGNLNDMEAIVKSAIWEFSTPFTEQYRAQGREEGRAQGEAEAILIFLESRGIAVSDEVRERVTSCTDQETLQSWLRRVAKVETAEELFD